MSAGGRLRVQDLGLVPYGEALALQRRLAEERIACAIPDTLLLLEHPPVVTLGRGTREASLPLNPDHLRQRGIEVFEIERGGDVTYHGPGQLIGYPIFDLQRHQPDLHWYLRRLEDALIGALGALGIQAGRRSGYTGVWVPVAGGPGDRGTAGPKVGDPKSATETRGGPIPNPQSPVPVLRKIASIGIHVRQWVTWHGFALNVTTDLSAFDLIVPCGIPDVVMTSVAREAPRNDPDLARWHGNLGTRARAAVIEALSRTFGFEEIEATSEL